MCTVGLQKAQVEITALIYPGCSMTMKYISGKQGQGQYHSNADCLPLVGNSICILGIRNTAYLYDTFG